MTALAIEKDVAPTGGTRRRLLSANAANPFAGSALSYDLNGYVHELVAGEPFAGFCTETIQTKDAATADGSRFIETVGGTFVAKIPFTVAVADVGRRVYMTDDNVATLTPVTAATLVGRVVALDTTAQAIVLCETHEMRQGMQSQLVMPGTALTASSTRTALATMTIKAGTLKVGSRIRVRGQAICSAENSTDTWIVDLGSNASVYAAHTATDAVVSDISFFDADFQVRTIGSSGTIAGAGHYTKTPAAVDTAVTKPFILVSTAIDTTIDQVFGLYGKFSTTNSGNSMRADLFSCDLLI